MARAGIHAREDVQLNAIGLNNAFLQGPDDFIITTGQSEFQFLRHGSPIARPPSPALARNEKEWSDQAASTIRRSRTAPPFNAAKAA